MNGEHFTLAIFEATNDLKVDKQMEPDNMFKFELKNSANPLYIMIWYNLIDKEYLGKKYREQNFRLLYYTLKNTRILIDVKKITVANLIFVARPSLMPKVIKMCQVLLQNNELQYPLIKDLNLTTINAQVLYFLHKATMNTEISRYFRIILTEKDDQQDFINEYSIKMKGADVLMLPEKLDSGTENKYKSILESFDILFDSIEEKFNPPKDQKNKDTEEDKITIYSYFINPKNEKHKFINIYAYIDSPVNEKEVKEKKPLEIKTNSTKSLDSSVNKIVSNIINRFYKIGNQFVYFVLRKQKRIKVVKAESNIKPSDGEEAENEQISIYIEKSKIKQMMKILPYFNSDNCKLKDISNYGKHLKISFNATSIPKSLVDCTNKNEMEIYEFDGFPKGMESKLLRMLSIYGANMIFWDEKMEKYIVYAPSTYNISEVFKNNIKQNTSYAPSITPSTTPQMCTPAFSNGD